MIETLAQAFSAVESKRLFKWTLPLPCVKGGSRDEGVLTIPVRILDAKTGYGQLRVRITPMFACGPGAAGERWIDAQGLGGPVFEQVTGIDPRD